MLAVDTGSPLLSVALAAAVVAAVWAVDHPRLSRPTRRLEVTLELVFKDPQALQRHLEERLNARIVEVWILEAVERAAALHDRVDVKYVVPLAAFEGGREPPARHACGPRKRRPAPTHHLLRHRGARRPSRASPAAPVALQVPLAREYVDSGLCAFEVKLKGERGRTVSRHVRELRRWLVRRIAWLDGNLPRLGT